MDPAEDVPPKAVGAHQVREVAVSLNVLDAVRLLRGGHQRRAHPVALAVAPVEGVGREQGLHVQVGPQCVGNGHDQGCVGKEGADEQDGAEDHAGYGRLVSQQAPPGVLFQT
jgi:hypothetical protein